MKVPNVIYPASLDGSVWKEEAEIIAKLVKYIAPKKAFEFGTFLGETSNNIAANLPEDGYLFTFDLLPHTLPDQELLPADKHYALDKETGASIMEEYAHKIIQVHCDLSTHDFTGHYGSVQLCFIDSGHDYNSVKRDSEIALKVVRNGLILWHDFSIDWPDVVKYINETFLDKPGFFLLPKTRLVGYWV